ncbi:MAG TPA: LptF/LptG family permease [Chitinophagaceae bacterium]|jgi:lipopolysaccharide export system permease protein|nr:LptF/LptG family permease [Chitinophagaceae bacterium]
MITKLDWYILKKFFSTFFFCMLMFTAIAVAVDSSEKTDDFVKTGLSTTQIITQYYTGFVPWIWGLLYPLFVFIAVIFFTSKMALRSEVIAILASGITFRRWLQPYLIGGIAFAAGLWFANRYGIPKANEIRSTFSARYLDNSISSSGRMPMCTNCFYLRVDTNTYIGIKYYDTMSRSSNTFFLERLRNNKVYYNLRAEVIQWDTAKNNWKLTNAMERKIDSMGETVRMIPTMNINLNLRPLDLRKDEYLKDKLTTPELVEYIRLEELRGTEGLNTLKVERHRRSATPFTVLLLTLIGAIVAGRKTRGGSGLHLAIGIGIAALFIISDRFSTVFSVKGNLPPVLAAWIPNLVFLVVAFYLYRKAPK